jgi:hypothetical protein
MNSNCHIILMALSQILQVALLSFATVNHKVNLSFGKGMQAADHLCRLHVDSSNQMP